MEWWQGLGIAAFLGLTGVLMVVGAVAWCSRDKQERLGI